MADNKQTPGSGEVAPTVAEYKKSQARVRDLVEKRRALERRLVSKHPLEQRGRRCGTGVIQSKHLLTALCRNLRAKPRIALHRRSRHISTARRAETSLPGSTTT